MFTFIVLHIFFLQMNLHLTRLSSQPSLALFFAPHLRQSSSLLQMLLATSCTLWIGMILSFAIFLLVVDRNFALCLDKCSSSFEDNIRVSAFFSFVLIFLGPINSSVVVSYRKYRFSGILNKFVMTKYKFQQIIMSITSYLYSLFPLYSALVLRPSLQTSLEHSFLWG